MPRRGIDIIGFRPPSEAVVLDGDTEGRREVRAEAETERERRTRLYARYYHAHGRLAPLTPRGISLMLAEAEALPDPPDLKPLSIPCRECGKIMRRVASGLCSPCHDKRLPPVRCQFCPRQGRHANLLRGHGWRITPVVTACPDCVNKVLIPQVA